MHKNWKKVFAINAAAKNGCFHCSCQRLHTKLAFNTSCCQTFDVNFGTVLLIHVTAVSQTVLLSLSEPKPLPIICCCLSNPASLVQLHNIIPNHVVYEDLKPA